MRSSRPNMRARQKNLTLEAIKASAREIFCERNYDEVSIEDIAADAGVSRGTIYRHFPSKADLLFGLLQDDLDRQGEAFDELSHLEVLDYVHIRDWLGRFAAVMNDRATALRLFPIAFRQMPDKSLDLLREKRERAVAILGERFAGLGVGGKEGVARERARAKAYIFLFQLEQVASTFSWAPGAPDLGTGLDILAERMLAYKRPD